MQLKNKRKRTEYKFRTPRFCYHNSYPAITKKFGNSEKLLHAILGLLMNEAIEGFVIDGHKWIQFNYDELSDRVKKSRSTLQRYSRELCSQGILLVDQLSFGGDRTNIYSLDLIALENHMGFSLDQIFGESYLKKMRDIIQPLQTLDDRPVDNSIPWGHFDSVHEVILTPSYIESNTLTNTVNTNTVGFNKSVDNSVKSSEVKHYNIKPIFRPCDLLARSKPVDSRLVDSLKALLTEKEGSPLFLEAKNVLSTYESLALAA